MPIEPLSAMVLRMTRSAQPFDMQRLGIVRMMTVCVRLATRGAWLACDLSASDCSLEYLVGGIG